MSHEVVKPFEFVGCGIKMSEEEYEALQTSREQLMFFETARANNNNHFLPIPDVFEPDNNFQNTNARLFSKITKNDNDIISLYNSAILDNCEDELYNSVVNNFHAVFINGFFEAINPYYIWEPGLVDSMDCHVPSFPDFCKFYLQGLRLFRLDDYKYKIVNANRSAKFEIDPILSPTNLVHEYMKSISNIYSDIIHNLIAKRLLNINKMIEDWCASDSISSNDVDPGSYIACAYGILFDYARQDCNKLIEIVEFQVHNIMLKYIKSIKSSKDDIKRERARIKNGFKNANKIKQPDEFDFEDDEDLDNGNKILSINKNTIPPEFKTRIYRGSF